MRNTVCLFRKSGLASPPGGPAAARAPEGRGAHGAGARSVHLTAPVPPDARRLRAILLAVSTALMAVIASVSGLNVAQTHLAVEWGASQGTVLWIVNVYPLVLAALLLPLGAFGDRLGRKPVLVAGLVLSGAASAVAGLAPSAAVMTGARVAAGVGAAMIMPITPAVITSTFPAEQRGRAIGVRTGATGGGGVLGMFLSAQMDVRLFREHGLAAGSGCSQWRSSPVKVWEL